MIKSFSVKNYRNLDMDNLEFGRINLIVGPNNSGKSNFMRALSFFADIMTVEKDSKSSAFHRVMYEHDWDAMLKRGMPKPGSVEMKWVFDTEQQYADFTYGLDFMVDKAEGIPKGFRINIETLRYAPTSEERLKIRGLEAADLYGGSVILSENGERKEIIFHHEVHDSVFRQMDNLLDDDKFRMSVYPEFKKIVQTFTDYFGRFRQYTCNEFHPKAVSEAVDVALAQQFLNSTGSDFVNVISYLDEAHNFLDDYTERLRELIPNLRRIKIIHVSEKKRQMQLIIGQETFKLSEMSYGTIQVMLLTLLLWTPERMSILSLDEPEINLHPAWIKVIGDWVTKSTSAKQLFISTHSPDFLDRFTDLYRRGEVALFTFHLNQTPTVKRVYPDKLDVFFEQGWELGDLYRVGEPELGGWPW